LAVENQRFVPFVVRKYYMNIVTHYFSGDIEEVIQIGIVGLVKASKTFVPEKGKFLTYAFKCIRNEIFIAHRKMKKDVDNRGASLNDDTQVSCKDDDSSLDEFIGEVDIRFERVESDLSYEDISKKLLAHLSRKELDIVAIRLKYPKITLRQIGDMMGISQSYVSRLVNGMKERVTRISKKHEINIGRVESDKDGRTKGMKSGRKSKSGV